MSMKRPFDATKSIKRVNNSCFSSDALEGTRQSSMKHFFAAKPKKKARGRLPVSATIRETNGSCVEDLSSQAPVSECEKIAPSPAAIAVPTWRAPHRRKAQQQLYLDLGQESFGRRTLCHKCGMLYDERLQEDSKQHSRICNDYVHGVPFQAESARIVASFDKNTFIIEVRPSDSYSLRQKVSQVRIIVDKELGFVPDAENDKIAQRWTYLYILNKRVVGMVSAESIREAYFLHDNNFDRDQQKRKALIGIHQIWVHSRFRRRAIASRLIDTVREKMLYGMVIPRNQVAFSSPTEAGASFARRYSELQSHITPSGGQALVYDCN